MKFNLIAVITLFILTSCDQTDSRQTLSPEVKYMSDTMFAKRKADLNLRIDSICGLNYMSYKEMAIDSLLKIEKARIAQLSKR